MIASLSFNRPGQRGLLIGAGMAISIMLAAGGASADDTLVFTSLGGALQKGAVAAMVQPAADKLHITFKQDSMDGIENVRVQVQSGAPAWDIVQMGSDECVSAEKEGI